MGPAPPSRAPGTTRRVLVTGGAGFIGSHLVERLVGQGDAVTVVDDLSTGRRENLGAVLGRVELVESDLSDAVPALERLAPFDRVYHLAAAVGVDLVLRDPVRSIEVNVESTARLLRHLAAHGRPPTMIASSSEVYGKPGTSVFSEEDDALYGSTAVTRWSYAHAKALDEHLALAYHARGDLPTVVVRFFNTVGPRQRGDYGMVLPRFVAAAMEGRPLRVFGDGRQTRCFCDVRDSVPALVALMETPGCLGRVYNLGSDREISIRALADRVIAVVGGASRVEPVAYADAYPGGFEDLRHRRPDLTRVRAAVGFEPGIGLDQTIRDVAADLRARRAEAARTGAGVRA